GSSGQLFRGSMTPDGRYVAFFVIPLGIGLVIWDSQSATTVATGFVDSGAFAVSISPDGNRIAYASPSGIYGVDRAANTRVRIASGLPGSYPGLQFSSDGRFLAYATGTSVVAADTNNFFDVYVYDFVGNTNLLVSRAFNSPGSGNGSS